jgi:hypothetical protein
VRAALAHCKVASVERALGMQDLAS